MKRTAYISVLMAVAAVLGACRKEEEAKPDEGMERMSFEAYVPTENGGVSRAALVEDVTGIESSGISLFSTLNSRGQIAAAIDNARLEYSDGEWSYSPERFWFYGQYTFAGLYPYTEGLVVGNPAKTAKVMQGTMSIDSGLRINVTNCSLDRNTNDILFGSAERTQTTDAEMDISTVPILLRHTASAVGFRLRNTSGTTITAISDIRLTGHLFQGDVTFTPDTDGGSVVWTPTRERVATTDRTTYTDACTVPAEGWATDAREFHNMLDNGYFIVMPQRVAGQNVTFSFTYTQDGYTNTANADISGVASLTTWEIGKRYTYDITISRDDILLEIHIVDWKEDKIPLE